MPAGLTILNDAYTVQVDETWRNYGFKYKFQQSFTTSQDPGGAPYAVRYQFTAVGSPALLCAISSPVQAPFRLHSYYDGATWTFNWLFLHDNGSDVYIPGSLTGTADFYIFDVLDGGSYSNVGLEVFNAAGLRVYHSDASAMKCNTIQQCTSAYASPDGRLYAPLIMRNPYGGVSVGGAGMRQAQYCMVSNGLLIKPRLKVLETSGTLISGVDPGLFGAIDVTGLS